MTKHDCIRELSGERVIAQSAGTDYFRGQADALEYAMSLVARIHPYAGRKTYKSIDLVLTREQARYLESLLGNGEMDRLIRGKIGRAMSSD